LKAFELHFRRSSPNGETKAAEPSGAIWRALQIARRAVSAKVKVSMKIELLLLIAQVMLTIIEIIHYFFG
jgi:hypothetical protein